jgi:hypothetical protein
MLYRYFKIVIDVWVSWEIIALFYGISSISVSLCIYKKKTFAKDRGSNISEDKETSRTETFFTHILERKTKQHLEWVVYVLKNGCTRTERMSDGFGH